MSRIGSRFGLFVGIGLLSLTGCYSYHPWGTHPGMMAPGGQPMFPPLQTAPQSTFVMPGDAVGSPSGSVVTPPSSFGPDRQLQAPEPGGASANPVPAPREPGENLTQAPGGLRSSQFQTPQSPVGRLTAPGQPDLLRFREPVVLSEATGRSPVVSVSLEDQLSDPADAGFAHDPQYRWFQGVAEFDAESKAWHLLYDLSPNVHDQLGGEIQLRGDVQLDPRFSGRLIRVSGEFDTRRLDQLNKPVYAVQRIEEVRSGR